MTQSTRFINTFAAETTKASGSVPYYIPNTGGVIDVSGLDVTGNVDITNGTLTFSGETGGLDMGGRPATLSGLNTISGLTNVTQNMTFNDAANLKICYPGQLQLATSVGAVAGILSLPGDNTNIMSIGAVGSGGLLLEAATGSVEMAVNGGQEVAAIVDVVDSAFRVGSQTEETNNIRIFPYVADQAFNATTQLNDHAIIYGENLPGRNGLTIAPWTAGGAVPASGMRLDGDGNLTVLGNLSLASAQFPEGLFNIASLPIAGSFILGNTRIVYGRTDNTDGGGNTAFVFATAFAVGTVPYVVATVYGGSNVTIQVNGLSNTGFNISMQDAASGNPTDGVSAFFFAVGQVA